MAKYDYELKLKLVMAYLDGDGGFRALGAKFGVDHTKIRGWVTHYRLHGTEGLRKKFSHYSASFKLSVLQQMWNDGLSYGQTAAVFGIRNPWCLAGWERLYRSGGIEALEPRKRGRPKAMDDPKSKPPPDREEDQRSREELLGELNHLRMENAYLKKLEALVRARQAPKKRK
jgi:transposase